MLNFVTLYSVTKFKLRISVMSFSNTIIQLRNKAKLTQEDVAKAAGIARGTYVKLENNLRQPKLDELKLLSKYYELGVEDLISGRTLYAEEPINKYERVQSSNKIEPRNASPEFSPEKLREVLLYVLNKIGAKPNIGETALYKLLYFIDMDYYERHSKSITGLTYIHNTFGPSPVSDFSAVVADMRLHDELDIVETKFFNNKQKKYLPHTTPDLRELSASEIKHIDIELSRLGDKNASELSDLSHKDTPWIVAKQGKPIDYRDVFYRTPVTAVTEPDDEL